MAHGQLQPSRYEVISPFLERRGLPWTLIKQSVWASLVDRGLTGVPLPTVTFGLSMKRVKELWENSSKVILSFSKMRYVQLPFTPLQLGFATPKRKRSHSEPNISITNMTFSDDGNDHDNENDESFAVPFSPDVTPNKTTKDVTTKNV